MTRLDRFKRELAAVGADAAVISSQINIRYMTGFDYTDGYVLITKNKSYVLADFRYIEAANMTVDKSQYEVVMPSTSMLTCLSSLMDNEGVKTVLFEEATLSYSDYERMKKMFVGKELSEGASKIADGMRLYKDADEIEKMKKAQAITDAGFSHMLKVLTPNMTEIEAALELEFFMRRMGSDGLAFDTIAASGTASALPHAVPRNVKLERGFFTLDFGARVDGYCSDMTRTVVLGKADEDMKKLYNTVLLAQTTALEALHEGMLCRDADKIARDIINGAGYEGRFGHSLGHGVGMYIHEAPRLASIPTYDVTLSRGHVVTVEPGIYLEGQYGCRIEDMVACCEDGSIYDFTQSKKELIELF